MLQQEKIAEERAETYKEEPKMKGDDHLQCFKGLFCFSTENLHMFITLANQFI